MKITKIGELIQIRCWPIINLGSKALNFLLCLIIYFICKSDYCVGDLIKAIRVNFQFQQILGSNTFNLI